MAPAGRGEYVAAHLGEDRLGCVVDIGCAYGWALGPLVGRCERLIGVDTDAAALEIARRNYPSIEFAHQSGVALPLDERSADVGILSDVIEHVPRADWSRLMIEIRRVLRPGGRLLFTAPYAGIFAWADPMDVKRRMPFVYRIYQRLSGHDPATPASIGHQHVSERELEDLLTGFEVAHIEFTGVLTPFFLWLVIVLERLRFPAAVIRLAIAVRTWESGLRVPPRLASNVRLVADRAGA
jgi:SAM-dependent methyltransferase